MAGSSEITPSRSGPPPGPIEVALGAVDGALAATHAAVIRVREIRAIGGDAAVEVALHELADLLRNLEHTAGASKRMVIEVLDYPSGREIRVVSSGGVGLARARRVGILMTAVAGLLTALAAAWQSITGGKHP